jgi:predicted nucleotidyltransferase component of viral defense system
MIERDEIDAMATELGVSVPNVERDYLFGWLIAALFHETDLGESIVLKGGNALRKGYLPAGRFSEDLDFGSPAALDSDYLLDQFNLACRAVEASTGVAFDLHRNRVDGARQIDEHKRVYKARLYFRDFADQGDHVTISIRTDITEFDRLALPVQSRPLIHQYSDSDELAAMISVVKLEEALADKLKCLIQRRSCFDLFDAVYGIFVNDELVVDRREILDVFFRKTIFSPAPNVAKNLLTELPFHILEPFWDRVISPASSRLTFAAAAMSLVTGVSELFSPFSQVRGSDLAFYPAVFRNPIMEAGASRRILEVRYKGQDRLVEPYELAFKRRKDGVGQEYLYVWERSGGGSGPGIKSFLPIKMQSVTITDEIFEPRFDIDLSRAGGTEARGHFYSQGRFRRLVGLASRRTPTYGRQQYTVECFSCGRRFSRSTTSTTLRPHKDQYGGACYGRSGFRVL